MLLLVSGIVSADTLPISFITAQCRNIQPIKITISDDLASDIHKFELQSLKINNINDSINFLLHNKLSRDDKSPLVNCQILLADNWNHFLESNTTQHFINQLNASSRQYDHQLARQLENAIQYQMTRAQKAQLRTYESMFRSEFLALKPRLKIIDKNCKLENSTSNDLLDEFELTIARYLLHQPDESCRKAVWETYYQRNILKQPLLEIVDIRQYQATSKGFNDFTQFKLANNYLNNSELVEQFLNRFTHSINIAPWSVGQELKSTVRHDFQIQNTQQLLVKSFNAFKTLGLNIETINNTVYRVWLHNRLLGDITIDLSDKYKKIQSKLIRYPVIGYQFGQASLSLPTELKSFRKVDSFVHKLSKIIAIFSDATPLYLTSKSLNNNDYSKISDKWLAEYLFDQLHIDSINKYPRQLLAKQYIEQLEILRAKVALNLYRKNYLQLDLDILFQDNFGAGISSDVSFPISFNGIIELGPMYYQKLWQKKLGTYLYIQSKTQDKANYFFDVLVVNEQRLSFQQQLENLLTLDITPSKLIEELSY